MNNSFISNKTICNIFNVIIVNLVLSLNKPIKIRLECIYAKSILERELKCEDTD